MDKFEHKLRTTLHTRSVENIMTRSQGLLLRGRESRPPQPKLDNISTFLRKFQIDRENLNLAKRIMECQSEHSRNKYVKEWRKTKKYLRVRSNFKPQLYASQPKIYRFEEIPGNGRLLVRIQLQGIESNMKQLNSSSLYLLKFNLGGTQLIPNKEFLTLDTSAGYSVTFLAPTFLRNKCILVKLIKVVENNLFEAGKFAMEIGCPQQEGEILNKIGKPIGYVWFKLQTEVREKEKRHREGEDKQNSAVQSVFKQNSQLIGGSEVQKEKFIDSI